MRLLHSLLDLKIPANLAWELLIIDNASTDDTGEVLKQIGPKFPMRTVYAATPGVSHARNAVLENAQGRWIICTDDDATVPPDWVEKYLQAFRKFPLATFFGGGIVPEFPGADEDWKEAVLRYAPTAFAEFPVGHADIRLDRSSPLYLLPYGANFALFAERARQARYRPELGRQPGAVLIGGEETQYLMDLVNLGHSGWFVANHPVSHWVEEDRQTLSYLAAYFYGQGWQSGTFLSGRRFGRDLASAFKLGLLQLVWPYVRNRLSVGAQIRVQRDLSLHRGARAAFFKSHPNRLEYDRQSRRKPD